MVPNADPTLVPAACTKVELGIPRFVKFAKLKASARN